MDERNFCSSPSIVLQRIGNRGDVAHRIRVLAALRDGHVRVVTDRRKRHGLAGKRPAQVDEHTLFFELRVLQDVIVGNLLKRHAP